MTYSSIGYTEDKLRVRPVAIENFLRVYAFFVQGRLDESASNDDFKTDLGKDTHKNKVFFLVVRPLRSGYPPPPELSGS